MLIFAEQRLTFLATPKTGTTAVEMALRPQAEISFGKRRKHISARRFCTKVAPFLSDSFGIETETVAVMRDPLDQIASWYRYRTRPQLAGTPRATGHLSFDEFVQAVISDPPPECARIGNQYDFLTDGKGKLLVDHLFAYDNQPAFLTFLQERLGTEITLQRKNVSPRSDVTLSEPVLAALKRARAGEFALYDRLIAAGGYLSLQ